MLNRITGIDRPNDGEVIVAGQEVTRMSEDGLARRRGENVGIIFQFFQMLPSLTLLNNVVLPMELAGTFGNTKERRQRAMGLLAMVGLADQAHKLPGTVSGGQQQRAAITRALANDPLDLGCEPVVPRNVQHRLRGVPLVGARGGAAGSGCAGRAADCSPLAHPARSSNQRAPELGIRVKLV
jgi:ABC-type taurine transport system ATPase subunit